MRKSDDLDELPPRLVVCRRTSSERPVRLLGRLVALGTRERPETGEPAAVGARLPVAAIQAVNMPTRISVGRSR